MRRSVAYPLAAAAAVAAPVLVAAPASAHGYVSAPPSRQALCATGAVPDCGPIKFEPQSVEGPKGLKSCDGGLSQFSVLADESRDWPAQSVGTSVDFRWVFTARHRTANWEYFIGGTKVAAFDGGNQQPAAVVTHKVDLSKFPGKRTVLAVWNIGDTANAFYSCIDLNVGGGGNGGGNSGGGSQPAPAPAPTAQPTTRPTTPAPAPSGPATSAPTGAPAAGGTWKAGVTFKTGDVVTFNGARFRCRQGHTSLPGWEPSQFTLALWLPL
ncbi:lytic polysaccharide monooxygenase [Actinomadura bangladeshensis]|uniref:Cellulose-binding protein n=1 Tax=Actinomadura bangladeshensis TaxID=453573 RepID=A0A6L9QL62_9ACTN|nr:lytic polysaccharide monooxygenase [Actinomadura bangladeshensis]NEA25828.1 cellulose-binding protein [Actinomadura bangladeshensis]